MRLNKNEIRSRVKRDFTITFSEERITADGGLELFRRYFVAIDLAGRLRRAIGDASGYGGDGADSQPARTIDCGF